MKDERLTFFQTLKEGPTEAGETFVPFKPTGETPPPLEALIPKEASGEGGRALPASPEPTRPMEAKKHSRYYVQVAEFQYKENARRLIHELRQQGYKAATVTVGGRRKPHQVKVGPYGSRQEAFAVARRLQKKLLYPTSVVRRAVPKGAVSRKNMD